MNRQKRARRHYHLRKKVVGVGERPRLSVFRSGQHIYAQIIDDAKGATLTAESDLKDKGKKGERAYNVGKRLAKRALAKKIKTVIFDRGGFLYHGRVAELARGAREGGLKF